MFFYDITGENATGRESHFMYKVYAWMGAALFVTGAVAFGVLYSPTIMSYIFRPGIALGLCLGSLVLVIMLSAMIQQMSFTMALIVYFAYAAVLGLMLSSIFVVYTQSSIYATFFITAGMFGCMALYGMFTRADLTSVGSYAVMALWGLILAMIVNIFLASSQLEFIISLLGVILFVVLTAVDTQKIKQLANQLTAERQMVNKVALICALTLYLDFINLFLFLLRFMGNRKE